MTNQKQTGISRLIARWPWLETAAFVAPMVVHMLVPEVTKRFFDADDPSVEATAFTVSVLAQVIAGFALLWLFHRVWTDHFKLRFSVLSIVVGVIGYVLWVWICGLEPERSFLSLFGLEDYWAKRTAFNPFDEIQNELHRYFFLALRFTTLALIVPVAEELFLRGFLVRWIEDVDIKSVTFDKLGWAAIAAPTICSVLTHPEIVAAVVWFSLVTWLMVYTRSFWNCVIAHMVTNLLLGIHVVATGAWELW
jgi:CAAX prenyl protease-like protein